jgi:hypothetical protein
VPIHDAANILPPIDADDLAALAEDINEHGQQLEIALFQDSDGNISLLDGRSRLDAMERADIPIIKDGALDPDVVKIITVPGNIDPYDYVMSANVYRRHLRGERKRQAVADYLKVRPELSNRYIARLFGYDHKTVGDIRAEGEAGGEIPHLTIVTGADGKSYPVPEKKPEPEEYTEATADDPESNVEQDDAAKWADAAGGHPWSSSHCGAGTMTEVAPVEKTKAEVAADKFAADLECVEGFPHYAQLALSYIKDMLKAQQVGRRLLKRKRLSEDLVDFGEPVLVQTIETIVSIDLEPVKKILNQASKIEMPEAS